MEQADDVVLVIADDREDLLAALKELVNMLRSEAIFETNLFDVTPLSGQFFDGSVLSEQGPLDQELSGTINLATSSIGSTGLLVTRLLNTPVQPKYLLIKPACLIKS